MATRSETGTNEAARIADQLRRAFDGSAWHGPSLLELLADIDAATAAGKPLPNVHSIWELVLHIAVWDAAAIARIDGTKTQPAGELNFPPVRMATPAPWRKAIANTKRTHDALVRKVAALPDSRLRTRCPGKRYDLYHLRHGVVQHELYHAGQIAILKKAGAAR
jgi:uncharacterized damage-inducible protein DinB